MTAPDTVHQDRSETYPDRYPRLFGGAADLLGGQASNILSFGCSSGEEVIALRGYFPDATITGAEINRAQLAACRRRRTDPRIAFIQSTRAGIAARGPYHAIFCMAVLQRRPHAVEKAGLTDIAKIYPFSRFADEVAFLAGQLHRGGLLIVEHSQYRVEDVAIPQGLETVRDLGFAPAKGLRFYPDGKVIVPQPVIGRIFRRAGGAA